MGGGDGDDRVAREALRLLDRYVDEAVLAFGLCPWAEPALRAGRVRRAVVARADPSPADVLAFIDEIAGAGFETGAGAPGGDGGGVDIGLLVFPRARLGWSAFVAFAERAGRADRARRAPGAAAPFLIAAFHPDGAERLADTRQIVSFLRRTPHPMLQLVRASIVDGLRKERPELSEEIARRNHAALAEPGAAERFEEVIRGIAKDREGGDR